METQHSDPYQPGLRDSNLGADLGLELRTEHGVPERETGFTLPLIEQLCGWNWNHGVKSDADCIYYFCLETRPVGGFKGQWVARRELVH